MAQKLFKDSLVDKINELMVMPILPNGKNPSRKNIAEFILSLQDKYYYHIGGKEVPYAIGGIEKVYKTIQKKGASAVKAPPAKKEQFLQEIISPAEEHILKRKVKEFQSQLSQVMQEREELEKIIESMSFVRAASPLPPKWLASPRGKVVEMAIPTAQLSDCHFDEVVNPDQLNGVNAYNRVIGEARLKKFFENTLRISTDYINGVNMDGLVLNMTGDIVSGNIHEELAETNEVPILPTCLFWAEQIIAGIELLGTKFSNIFIPCVTGNHGRQHRKPRAKNRAYQNYDWLIYKIIEKHFSKQKEITFQIPSGFDAKYDIYDTRYRTTHGDSFRGGGGIGGVVVPILRGDSKKRKREVAVGTPYDILVIGHFHQLTNLNGLIINGSLKGYDEYAEMMNFEFEPPQQAYWLTVPKHGKRMNTPIDVYADFENYRPDFIPAMR
jgi:hypothetical protein